MMNKFFPSIAVILTAMLGQQCSQSDTADIEKLEKLPPHDFIGGADRVIYIRNMSSHEYREEITGTRLKQLREFLSAYPSVTPREEPSEKEQIIELLYPVVWISERTRLLIPGKMGKRVVIDLTAEEAEKFFMILGRNYEYRARAEQEKHNRWWIWGNAQFKPQSQPRPAYGHGLRA